MQEQKSSEIILSITSEKIYKMYEAIVVGQVIGSFEINKPIGRDKHNRVKMSVRSDGKEAISIIKLNKNLGNYSVLDILIKTGRTHQIRVHLNANKLPIIGDKTYNPSNKIAKETPHELIETVRIFRDKHCIQRNYLLKKWMLTK